MCALARVTTEALLREVLGLEDAHELFTGCGAVLRGVGTRGVFPHDLARDALEADLRWRDPEGYRRVFRGVRGHINGRLQTSRGQEQQRAIADAKYMFRRLPGVGRRLTGTSGASSIPSRRDRGTGSRSWTWSWMGGGGVGAIAARWWEQQPEGFFVVRGQDGVIGGFLALLDLTRASAEDIAADPGARAAWDYAQRHAAPRPTETVTQSRFIIDREAYQGPSATLNATPILTMQRYLGTPNLAWDFLTLAEPSGGTRTSLLPICRARSVPTSGWAAAATGCSPMTSDRSRWMPCWSS